MVIKGFTKVDNSILFDSSLSLEAKALYSIIKHLSTIPNFQIRREYVKSLSGYGETAFRRVWKELKDKGLLMETKLRNKGKYVYIYTLKTSQDVIKVTAPVEEKKPKYKDSDGNIPLDGQLNIDDVLLEEQQEVPIVNENIAVVSETTGFTNSESVELLQVAENNVAKVIESYNYASKQKNVNSLFKYTKWVIANKIKVKNTTVKHEKKSLFNDYKQRTYDFGKLEKALLYGEQYELPA